MIFFFFVVVFLRAFAFVCNVSTLLMIFPSRQEDNENSFDQLKVSCANCIKGFYFFDLF